MSRVTIGVPVFNGENWLAATVNSVLDQTFADLKVVICDNASTDGSAEIASALVKQDERITYHRNQENVGVFRNFDRAFELSDSEFFKWCAVGDLIDKSFVARAVEALDRRQDAVLAYSQTELFGEFSDKPEIQDVEMELDVPDAVARYRAYFGNCRLNNLFHGLIRSDALSRTGLNKRFRGSDQCVVAALLLRGPFVRLGGKLLYRRVDVDTSTARKSASELRDFFSSDLRALDQLPTWKFQLQLFVDLLRSPLRYSEKLTLVKFLIKKSIWRRRELVEEARHYLLRH
ncbi:glycosyltransferase family 2 protein [Lentisalinibacter salinarum]|uniref:glycosyltransferase family 2 protein n=1 Tax=Lentisalinibacter salinarum TaxID=2992239 RepID=UPI00386E8ECF